MPSRGPVFGGWSRRPRRHGCCGIPPPSSGTGFAGRGWWVSSRGPFSGGGRGGRVVTGAAASPPPLAAPVSQIGGGGCPLGVRFGGVGYEAVSSRVLLPPPPLQRHRFRRLGVVGALQGSVLGGWATRPCRYGCCGLPHPSSGPDFAGRGWWVPYRGPVWGGGRGGRVTTGAAAAPPSPAQEPFSRHPLLLPTTTRLPCLHRCHRCALVAERRFDDHPLRRGDFPLRHVF